MKPRLQRKFAKNFIFPLLCGIFISIVFTVAALLTFTNNLKSSVLLTEEIQKMDDKKSLPILSNVGNILFKKLQMPGNALIAIKEYYKYLVESQILNLNNRQNMIEFIKKYSINSIKAYENFDETVGKVENSKTLDYSNWFLNPSVQDPEGLNDLQLKHLYLHTNLNLMYRAHYEINQLNENQRFIIMYCIFESTQLYLSYPLEKKNSAYESYKTMENRPWCKNEKLESPTYYYYKCRPWYIDIQTFYKDLNMSMIISNPYLDSFSGEVVTTICTRFIDPLTKIKEDRVIICIDVDLTKTFLYFDALNNNLNGYFFIMRIKSVIPVYYPNVVNLDFKSYVTKFEFNNVTPYFINDINDFNQDLDKFNEYDVNQTNYNSPGDSYQRNSQEIIYELFPIKFNFDEATNKTVHLLTIVYVNNRKSYLITINHLQRSLNVRLYFQLIIFTIMGSILILISRYLIISIAKCIVQPIRLIKSTLEGLNNQKLSQLDFNIDEDKSKDFKRDDDQQYINISYGENEEVDMNQVDEYIEEDDNVYIETRSEDIDELFATLLKLKNVLTYTQDTSLEVDKENILNYLFAKKTFIEVNNYQAKFLCDSNVGNLAIKCKKYDKAIFHLLQAISPNLDLNKDFSLSNLLNKIKNPSGMNLSPNKISKIHNSNKTLDQNPDTNRKSASILNKLQRNFNPSIKPKQNWSKKFSQNVFEKLPKTNYVSKNNKKLIESRLPKLLYSFKKYYQNLKKLKNCNFDSLIEKDVYSLNEKHSLKKYENTLFEYFNLASELKDNRKMLESLLELLQFFIDFKLKSLSKNENMKQIKENLIIQITEGFKYLDNILINLMEDLDVNDYLKKITEIINVSKKESLDMLEIPLYVLNQRANYLKGKFCYYCENFTQALEFFEESRTVFVISNGAIIRDSIKKSKKILKYTNKKVLFQLEEIPFLIQTEKNVDNIKKLNNKSNELEQLFKKSNYFIELLESEINKYTVIPKDICLIVNFNITDSKQIDKAMILVKNIFDNFVTSDDRFTLFSYTSHANVLVNLSYKNIATVDYIRDQILKFSDKEFYQNNLQTQLDSGVKLNDENTPDTKLFKVIEDVLDYVRKKQGTYYGNTNYLNSANANFSFQREIWINVITHNISEHENKFFMKSDIQKDFLDNCDNCFLNIIKTQKIEYSEMPLVDKLDKLNKCGLIESEELELLKKKMRIIGYINDEFVFIQEKYDNK